MTTRLSSRRSLLWLCAVALAGTPDARAEQDFLVLPPGAARPEQPARTPPERLPADAREVLDRLAQKSAEAREQLAKETARQQQAAIEELRKLATAHRAAGQSADADAVDQLVARMEAAEGPFPDPGSVAAYRQRAGESIKFIVTGQVAGTVWGADIYTDDSSLGAAAVHAGLVKPGERAMVKVTLLPGRVHYDGATRNGVTSHPYPQYDGSFRFEPNATVRVLTGAPSTMRGRFGETVLAEVTGTVDGQVWGDGVYTDDSPVATAVVHAGLLKPGARGLVTLTIRPGREAYTGSTKNGVTSKAMGEFGGSYEIVKAAPLQAVPEVPNGVIQNVPVDPNALPNLAQFRGQAAQVFHVDVTGDPNAGTVWGSGPYTDDSAIAAAAVHAGLLKPGQKATLKLTTAPGQPAFTGSDKNGVATQDYGPWGGGYTLEAMGANEAKPDKVYTLPAHPPIDLIQLRVRRAPDPQPDPIVPGPGNGGL